MKNTTILTAATLLLLASPSVPQVPKGFTWMNLESNLHPDLEPDKTVMAQVRSALRDTPVSAIREVGVEDGFALVMTTTREPGTPTPDYDRWSISSISLATGKSRLLVSGHGVKLIDWIGPSQEELAITYFDCWECEPATLFTTLRFKPGEGWYARWPNDSDNPKYPQPGAIALISDLGESADEEDEEVFALVEQANESFAAGNWIRSHDTKTGKYSEEVQRYSFDPVTKEDRVEKLNGPAALKWEREICTDSNILIEPKTGQDSKACKAVLRATTPRKQR